MSAREKSIAAACLATERADQARAAKNSRLNPGPVFDQTMQAAQFPTDGQTIRLIPLSEVIRLTGRSRSKIYADARAGKFPKPAKDGTSSRWVESEVLAWNFLRVAERDKAAA